ncbi:MAG: hypothetical protein NPINA01_25360 [Nitrospinaceae bacterium]|nr:MAG: hypothetical protein NPINA01_25360 [Nitrospinaceae bacterium]
MNPAANKKDLLTIGELSRLTGITTFSLRMWEKRYGAPKSQRLPSGHRRYPKDEVPRLRAIAKALDSGYRASKVVCGTLEELHKLLGSQLPLPSSKGLSKDTDESFIETQVKIERWLEAVHRFDEFTLTRGFHDEWGKNGPLDFTLNFAVPFVYQVGQGWETGELTVSQEHFASEKLEHFLSGMWRRMNERKQGPVVLLTTLPKDPHRLGIQMCAAVTAITEARVIYLGPDTPCEEILWAVEQCQTDVLCISVSPTMDPVEVVNHLQTMRINLKQKIELVVGGTGVPQELPGIIRLNDFSEYYDWLTTRKIK